jgi:hypothetical protein
VSTGSKEIRAADDLKAAEKAMTAAAAALYAVGSDEAVIHAAELIGAIKMIRRWELKLRKLNAERREPDS